MNSSFNWFCKQAAQFPVLSDEEEKELCSKLSSEATRQEAKELLINSNYRLVIKEVKKFIQHPSIDDLIQEGNLGLCEAAEKFDNSLGYKFSTYATYCIKQHVLQELSEDSSLIRLPANIKADIRKLNGLLENAGDILTDSDICKKLEWTELKLNKIRSFIYTSTSMDKSANDDEEDSLYELVEDKNQRDPEELCIEECEDEIKSGVLKSLLEILTDGERKIIMMQFGIGCSPMSYKEIADEFEVTESRIETKSASALRKLRLAGAKMGGLSLAF